MVSRELIEEIRSRLNLVQIVEQVVPLKKSGRNHSGLCPFHQEKSPSFTVSEDKQLYHCFGCGAGGTVYNFLMAYHHLSFPEALERCASMAGIELKSQSEVETKRITQLKEQKRKLIQLMEFAADTYHKVLLSSPRAEQARSYLKSRKVEKSTILRFKLGFAPDAWDNLAKYLTSKGYSEKDAKDMGLLQSKKGGGFFDFFRSRVMFPIRDLEGKVIGFGGRILGDGNPKYLNSPQTILFDKGKGLFGLYEASDAIRREKNVFVVEGYMDQISLFETGFENTVATLGTAMTQDHAKLLKRYTDQVTLVFDGDSAGSKAILRAMKPLMVEGLSTSVVVLPTGEDPDSFAKKNGAKGFQGLVSSAMPIMRYYVENFYLKQTDIVKKAQAISEMVGFIQSCNLYMKEALIREVKDYAGISEEILRGEKKDKQESLPLSRAKMAHSSPVESTDTLNKEELLLLRLSVEVKDAMRKMFEQNIFSLFMSAKISEFAKHWLEKATTDTKAGEPHYANLIDDWEHEETRPLLAKIFMQMTLDFSVNKDQIWDDCVNKLKRKKITYLTKEVEKAEKIGDLSAVETLSSEVLQLKKSFFRSTKDGLLS